MSIFLGDILILWLIVYIMGWDIKIVFILFGIYLLLKFFTYLMNRAGFVTKEKYLKIVKDLKEQKELVQKLKNRETAAEQEIRRLIEEYGEDYELSIKVIGQNAVFKAFLYNKDIFIKHLNLYVGKNTKKAASNLEPSFDWRKTLGVTINNTYEEVKAAYRTLSKKYHPDKPGGSEQKMSEINRAWDQAEIFFKNA